MKITFPFAVVMRNMIKYIAIFVLTVYSTYITIKYVEERQQRLDFQRKLEEFYRWYEFRDTSLIKYVEVPVVKEVPRKETVYVYQKVRDTVYEVIPQRINDTLWGSFYWEWKDYIYVRDSIGLYSLGDMFRMKLKRVWGYKNPLYIKTVFKEKGVRKYYADYYIYPSELVENVNIFSYYKFKDINWFLGAGVIGDRYDAYPAFETSILWKRWRFDFGVSPQGRWFLTTNFRVY